MKSRSENKSFRIGIFFNRTNKASREQVAGIFAFAGNHPEWEPHLFTRPESTKELRSLVGSFTPDGIIAGSPDIARFFRRRLGHHVPNVLFDYYAEGTRHEADVLMLCDDHTVGRTVAQEFLRHGFNSFAFAGIDGSGKGNDESVNSINEENAFVRELKKSGQTPLVYRERVKRGNWHFSHEEKLIKWLKALPKPCALMTHLDTLASDVFAVCRKARIRIPSEIAIISVGNEESICESLRPPLSSVEVAHREAGRRGAELLHEVLLRRRRKNLIRETYGVPELIVRQSAYSIVGSRHLAMVARDTITAHALNGLRAAKILSGSGKSQRTMQNSYRKTYGTTIREDILRIRIEEAKRLLRDTMTPIGEIATRTGFRTVSALRALFTRRIGMSLRDYRRKFQSRQE